MAGGEKEEEEEEEDSCPTRKALMMRYPGMTRTCSPEAAGRETCLGTVGLQRSSVRSVGENHSQLPIRVFPSPIAHVSLAQDQIVTGIVIENASQVDGPTSPVASYMYIDLQTHHTNTGWRSPSIRLTSVAALSSEGPGRGRSTPTPREVTG
jgi:hypothetical protein